MVVEYYIFCFERMLKIYCPPDCTYTHEEITQALDNYYCEWHNSDTSECCEEYMMSRLEKEYVGHYDWYTTNERVEVEVCPHCGFENIYVGYDTATNGFIVRCKDCGKEIFLCDACQHTMFEDGEPYNCDWCETDCGGVCHRGIISTNSERSLRSIANEFGVGLIKEG